MASYVPGQVLVRGRQVHGEFQSDSDGAKIDRTERGHRKGAMNDGTEIDNHQPDLKFGQFLLLVPTKKKRESIIS